MHLPLNAMIAGPPPSAHVPPTALAGRLGRVLAQAWQRGWLPQPVLDPDALIARAVDVERLDDFGPDHWRAPMQVLVQALEGKADLNPLGRTMAHGQVLKALRERLRAQALWRRHPEILERPVPAPVIVLGAMRSGTTRVQRLLACDPRLAHTRLFESFNPVPGGAGPGLIARRASAAAALGLLHALNPVLRATHPTSANAPDEEIGMFGPSFAGAHFETQWRIPSFARWWERHDPLPVYRELRAMLQTAAWLRGEPPGRPQVLKVPQFTEELATLLRVFPDARLLCLHREPVGLVSSSCSLVWQQHRVQTDRPDAVWIGQEWLGKAARRVRIAAEVRAANPQVPQIDVQFDAMNRDWRGEMRRVYGWLGLDWRADVEARMARYLARARSHRAHRHAPEQFGLTAAAIRQAFLRPVPGPGSSD
jgi:hypothetical protein